MNKILKLANLFHKKSSYNIFLEKTQEKIIKGLATENEFLNFWKNIDINLENVKQMQKVVQHPDFPYKYILSLINAEKPEIRQTAALILNKDDLRLMMEDDDEYIRSIVAERINEIYLPAMRHDISKEVRAEVVKRIDKKYLPEMLAKESDKYIQLLIKDRMTALFRTQ